MMPNADGRRELPRRRNSGSPTSENSENANFVELRYGEVRRIPLPRTRVNKGPGGWRPSELRRIASEPRASVNYYGPSSAAAQAAALHVFSTCRREARPAGLEAGYLL